MKRGLRRTCFRMYTRLLNTLFRNSTSTLLIAAVIATIAFKFKKEVFDRAPASKPLIFDYYKAESRMMIPEYIDSLKEDR